MAEVGHSGEAVPLSLKWRGSAKWLQFLSVAVVVLAASSQAVREIDLLTLLLAAVALGVAAQALSFALLSSSASIDEDSIVVTSTFARPLRTDPQSIAGYFTESMILRSSPIRVVLVLRASTDWTPTVCLDFSGAFRPQARIERITAALDAVGVQRLDARSTAPRTGH